MAKGWLVMCCPEQSKREAGADELSQKRSQIESRAQTAIGAQSAVAFFPDEKSKWIIASRSRLLEKMQN
jgi:hypothetical protein